LASIKLKRANWALYRPSCILSEACSLFQTGCIDNDVHAMLDHMNASATVIDVEKSYGQKAALAVGALR
jgi:hypothetical protein